MATREIWGRQIEVFGTPEASSWKNVFNTSTGHYGYITYGQEAAAKAGYPYFVWSGWVYVTSGPNAGQHAGVLEEEVK
jgi:hypothetical protein